MPIATASGLPETSYVNIAPAISELGQEPLREMGCAHPGCTRRVGVMKAGQDRRGGGDYQSHGTGPDHDRDRYRRPLASAVGESAGSCSTTSTLTNNVEVGCSSESAPICPFQHVSVSISTTGWLTACAHKASILSNVPFLKCSHHPRTAGPRNGNTSPCTDYLAVNAAHLPNNMGP